jgi:HemY protein
MIRSIWFLLHIVVLAGAGVWLLQHPGTVGISFAGYDIEAHVAVAFGALVILFLILMAFYKIVGWVAAIPGWVKGAHSKKRRERGFKSLTLGLSAVAAGDAKQASYHAWRMRQFLGDEKGLPWLLEAQAARLRGDKPAADGFFEKLLKEKDTAFLGVRGLLQSAIENDDGEKALIMARQALSMHPDQAWIIETAFRLETRARAWGDALKTLKRADRAQIWDAQTRKRHRIAVLLQQAEEKSRAGFLVEAGRLMKEAYRLDPAYVPTALRLAAFYIAQGKRRGAVQVIERAWKDNPHPELAALWAQLAPPKKDKDMTAHLRWFERLVALKPGDVESQIAAASAAIEDGLWGEAWQYLSAAEKIRPSARLYKIWAQMEEKTGHYESARRYWEKASSAPGDKMWVCSETGRIYECWSAIAEPHGAFDTIVWDMPIATRGPVIAVGRDDVLNLPARVGTWG